MNGTFGRSSSCALALSAVLLGLGAFALSHAAAHHARLAEERRNFLDHVAHEVRTPAAAMLALSEELERGHFLAKPFTPDTLSSMVVEALAAC